MDFPLPLLERLKRHCAASSANAYAHVHKKRSPSSSSDDKHEKSRRRQSTAASPPSGARESDLDADSVTSSASVISWSGSRTDVDCSSTRSSRRRGKPQCSKKGTCRRVGRRRTKSDNFISSINKGSCGGVSSTSTGVVCDDTSSISSDILCSLAGGKPCTNSSGKAASTGSCTSGDAASSVTAGVRRGDGEFSTVIASHNSEARDSSNTNGQVKSVGKGAIQSESVDEGAQRPSTRNRDEDAALAAAKRTTLFARCAWSPKVIHSPSDSWICQGLYANEGFHCVYLLRSLQTPRCTYIGYSVNPLHRLRQHNGDVSHGGAWKTRRHRPWTLVLFVYGFPHAIAALQFEWRWQRTVHAVKSTRKPGGNPPGARTEKAVSLQAAPTRESGCVGADCPGVGQPSRRALAKSKGPLLTCIVAGARHSSQGHLEKHEPGVKDDAVVVRRLPEADLALCGVCRSPCLDRGDTGSLFTGSPAACGDSSSSLYICPTQKSSDHRAGNSGTSQNAHLLTGVNSMQPLSLASGDLCDQTSSVDDIAKFSRARTSPYRKSTAKYKTFPETFDLETDASSAVGCSDSQRRHEAYMQQRASYHLSRTGNGIVARVGPRLQTLLALLHMEPFRHMPLGVHVVDSYAAAPYFRLLLRERKAADMQRQQRDEGGASVCTSPRRPQERAFMRCPRAWMPLQRSLHVSFGEAAFFLPFIRQLAGGLSRNKCESSGTKGTETTHILAAGNSSGENKATSEYGSLCGELPSNESSSDVTRDVVEDGGVTIDTRTVLHNKAQSISAGTTHLECSDHSMHKGRLISGDLLYCSLCGGAFLLEQRKRAASRCGKCMSFSHLTCLARAALDEEHGTPSGATLGTTQKKHSTDMHEKKLTGLTGGCRYGNGLSGRASTEGCSTHRSYPGLLPSNVKCICCGHMRSWAEVLADGVVFSSTTVDH